MKPIQEIDLTNEDELRAEIICRKKVIKDLMGSLYPRIVQEEIDTLSYELMQVGRVTRKM